METLKRLFGLGYRSSQNKDTYKSIASEQGCSPRLVYRIAHGKKVKSERDATIRRRLREKEVIHYK